MSNNARFSAKKGNSNLASLVRHLSDSVYQDGTTIGKTMNITRGAVWKGIKKLQKYGIKIYSIKGKGYALAEPLILLDKKLIRKQVIHKSVILDIFESIGSTNDYLKNYFSFNKVRVCAVEHQAHGRGRFNRSWHSPFGQNIYLSCLYPFQKDLSELAGLSLVVSLAVIKTLKAYNLPAGLGVKWPNDVTYQAKKLAGCLIDVQAEANGTCSAIIGIGLNVNMLHDEKNEITQPWTSLRAILGAYVDRNLLCAALINNIVDYLQQFEKHSLSIFLAEWQQFDALYSRKVVLEINNNKLCGKAKGINEQGHLLIQLENGATQIFSSGDISLD